MKSKLLLLAYCFSVLLLILSSCKAQKSFSETPTKVLPKLENKRPDIQGEIKEVRKADNQVIGLFVVGTKDKDTKYDRASVGITKETRIFIIQNNTYKLLSPQDLKIGQTVGILFIGPIGTSYPVRAIAEEIVIQP